MSGMNCKSPTPCSVPRRVEWCGDMLGEKAGLHVRLHICGQTKLLSRDLAEQIRDELSEVLEQNAESDALT